MYQREQYFADVFFKDRPFSRPKFFPLSHPNMNRYTPDFYDIERDVYIEVVGTKQAYHSNKIKYQVFQDTYPDVKFELRRHTGEIYHPREDLNYPAITTMQKIINQLIIKYGTRARVAELLGVSLRYVYMLEKGDRKGGKHLKKFAKML